MVEPSVSRCAHKQIHYGAPGRAYLFHFQLEVHAREQREGGTPVASAAAAAAGERASAELLPCAFSQSQPLLPGCV
eukprot:COSAG02_NODE_3994_length_5940_cov_6.413457_4_plen_76_part_00